MNSEPAVGHVLALLVGYVLALLVGVIARLALLAVIVAALPDPLRWIAVGCVILIGLGELGERYATGS